MNYMIYSIYIASIVSILSYDTSGGHDHIYGKMKFLRNPVSRLSPVIGLYNGFLHSQVFINILELEKREGCVQPRDGIDTGRPSQKSNDDNEGEQSQDAGHGQTLVSGAAQPSAQNGRSSSPSGKSEAGGSGVARPPEEAFPLGPGASTAPS